VDIGRALPARIALGAAILLAAAIPRAAQTATQYATLSDRIHQKQAEVNAARKRLEAKRRELHFQEVRKEDLQRQLSDTNRNIAGVSASLDDLGAQIHKNEKRLAWNEIQLKAAQATLQRHTDALRRRLVDIYERGDLGYLNVLLSANAFSEFVERWDDIRYLVAANERTVRQRRAAEQAVSLARKRLETERASLEDLVRRQEQERFKLAALAHQRTQLVAVAEVNRRSVAHEVAELEDLTASEEAALEELIRERQIEDARAGKLAGRELPAAPGTFSWPVSGPITSPFGMRANPLGGGFEMHPGIDIGAPMGATITAAAAGRVILAGWYGGYGNAIIIDHGGSMSTLYGHCSQIFVASGQDVQRGQAIGAVGMTGRATGPHLHFEVRENGTPVDPTPRLR
jgi:murein DD-endopeptidase MepM/ murein hydrolase activator NlpD